MDGRLSAHGTFRQSQDIRTESYWIVKCTLVTVQNILVLHTLPLDPLFPFIAAKCLARKPSTRARSSWQAGKKNFLSPLPLDFAFCMLCHWLKVRVFRGGMRVIGIGDGMQNLSFLSFVLSDTFSKWIGDFSEIDWLLKSHYSTTLKVHVKNLWPGVFFRHFGRTIWWATWTSMDCRLFSKIK